MKQILFSGVLLTLLFVFSCTKDQFTEEQAQNSQKDLISYQDSIDQANANSQDSINQLRDSLAQVGGIIQFSVSVIPVDGGTGFVGLKSAKKAEMLAGAVVSVSQHGVLLTSTTDEAGIAVFTDLRVGTLNVHVRADDYTTANFIVEINPNIALDQSSAISVTTPGGETTQTEKSPVLRHAATMVPVFSLNTKTSNINGNVSYETDLTNATPESAAGVTVIARLDVEDEDFQEHYFKDMDGDNFGDNNARIVQIAYTDLVASAVTNATGDYSIDFPSAADGLPVVMEVSDIAVDQKLITGDVVDIRTIFGTTAAATAIPNPPSAYCTFSKPTGVVTQQPVVDAEAYAVVGESGIASINIVSQGDGYTQAPIIKITTTGNGEGAEATATITAGKVTAITITNPGVGYSVNDVINVVVDDKIGIDAAATPVITYSITNIAVANGGSEYKTVPNVVITSPSGTAASAKAIMSGAVSKITLTAQGSGYVCPPDVVLTGSKGADETATAVMTTYNPIHSIVLSQNYLNTNFFPAAVAPLTGPEVIISTTGTGSGAKATTTLSAGGRLPATIPLLNFGAGYLIGGTAVAPTVTISGGGGSGAVAEATVDALGVLTGINVLNRGTGYTSTPTVTISAPPAGGTQATVDAANIVRTFPIAAFTITNNGSGYNVAYNTVVVDADDYINEPTVTIGGVPIVADDDVTVRPDMKVEKVNIGSVAGQDYEVAPAVTFVTKCAPGTGTIVVAAATSEILSYVKSIQVVNGGSGFAYDAPANINVNIVTPAEGCLTQAKAGAVTLGNGVLSSIVLTKNGDNYSAAPRVKLVATGGFDATITNKDAVITATVSTDSVTGFTIVNAGKGYAFSAPNTFTLDITTQTMTANLDAEANATSGNISFVEVSNAGAGYTVVPSVKFIRRKPGVAPGTWIQVESGAYVDATATAVIVDGRVAQINIVTPGTGYYFTPEVVVEVPDYLQVAKGTCTINSDGYITGVVVTTAGEGYADSASVTFTPAVEGMGSGAEGTVVIRDGKVIKVVMTNNGADYLGKNTPTTAQNPTAAPAFDVYAGKTYIKDFDLGTGVRTE